MINRMEAATIFQLAHTLKTSYSEYRFIHANGVGTLYKDIATDAYNKASKEFDEYVNSLIKRD